MMIRSIGGSSHSVSSLSTRWCAGCSSPRRLMWSSGLTMLRTLSLFAVAPRCSGMVRSRDLEARRRVSTALADVAAIRRFRDTNLMPRLEAKRQELEKLEVAVKGPLDAQASRFPDRIAAACFGYLVIQSAVLFIWVYVQFDWNLVEPITYLLGYSVTWIAIALFGATGLEFSYDELRRELSEHRRRVLYAKAKFDYAAYLRLVEEIRDLEQRVAQLEKL